MMIAAVTSTNGSTASKPKGWVVLLGPAEFDLLAKIDSSPWVVYLVLRWFARDKSTCFPSVESIGDMIHTKPRAVRYALDHLEAAGFIRREVNRGKPTIYHLLTDAIVCSPSDGSTATFGIEPLQQSAATPATFGIEPLQQSAPKLELRKTRKKSTH